MRKIIPFLSVVSVPAVLLFLAFHTGSPGGKSGSPGDGGSTCTDCHAGQAIPASGWITSNIPPEGYSPDQTYNITAHGMHPGVTLFGFELTAEDEQGNKVGTLTITDPLQTQLTNGSTAITHTEDGITPAGNGKTWNMNWTAPGELVGQIGFYAAFNAANGNGQNSGDTIYTSVLLVSPNLPGSLTSISPNSAQQGENITTTIIGQNVNWNITAPTSVTLSNTANPSEVIEASDFSVINMNTLSADFDIPLSATPGMWDLHVDDLMLTEAFELILADPMLTGMDPASGRIGQTVTSRISGHNTQFTGTPDVSLSYHENPSEVIVGENIVIISEVLIQADFTIPEGSSVGFWDVHVDDLSLENAFKVDWGVGIESFSDMDNVKVYPNPTSGLLNLENLDNARLHIYNAAGEKVFSRDQSPDNVKIDLRDLPEGLYMLRIENGEQSAIKKIIIAK